MWVELIIKLGLIIIGFVVKKNSDKIASKNAFLELLASIEIDFGISVSLFESDRNQIDELKKKRQEYLDNKNQ